MKKDSLFTRIALLIVAITLVTGGIANLMVDQLIRNQTQERVSQEAYIILQSLDWALSPLLDTGDKNTIQRLLDNVGSFPMIDRLRIYNQENRILFSEAPLEDSTIDPSFDGSALTTRGSLRIQYRDPSDGKLVFAVPIRGKDVRADVGSDVQAVLMLKVNSSYEVGLSHQVSDSFKLFLLITVTLVLLLLFITMYYYLIRPLNHFLEFSEAVAQRKYQTRMASGFRFELKDLAVAFNRMVEETERYAQELNRARLEAEEQFHNRMQFFANMSHEIRTPLNSIIGFSELMEEDEEDAGKRSRLGVITRAGKHLVAIVNDILDVSRFELSSIALESKPFGLHELILELHRTYQPAAESKHLRLQFIQEPKRPLYLVGDPYRIRQIFNNLISNALKFTEKGSVRITVQWENPYLTVQVKDTGIGIPPEKHESIFDAFAQADMSTTRMYGGTGLGLAICKKLSEIMGGDIQLESETGKGTQFTVRLQLAEHSDYQMPKGEKMVNAWLMHDIELSDLVEDVIREIPQRLALLEKLTGPDTLAELSEAVHALKGLTGNFAMQELYTELVRMDRELKDFQYLTEEYLSAYNRFKAAVSIIPSRYFSQNLTLIAEDSSQSEMDNPISVLLAEDVLENRTLVQQILSKISIRADEAENGQLAVEMLSKHPYDLLLLDMHMPVLDGLGVLRELQKSGAPEGLQIIAMTASTQKEQVEEYLQMGCHQIIPKPIDKELLRRTVLDLIQNKTL